MKTSDMEIFFKRANQILDRLEDRLNHDNSSVAFATGKTGCWRYSPDSNRLETVKHVSRITLDDLKCIERQKQQLISNTLQFIQGLPANNALLWGPRGTGKSSLIKAIFNRYHTDGLKLIEIQRDDLKRLMAVCDLLYEKKGRFLIFCDDLSFEADDPGYKAVKVMLDGSVNQLPDNVLLYATSNRRHLVPEHMSDNLQSGMEDGDLHLSESIEEKLSLSERFGLWVSFHPFNQDQYLEIVDYWLAQLMDGRYNRDQSRQEALKWALLHGSRSGRSAQLFSRDYAGKARMAR
jgi:predicted AAA+ superfamily ATPase